MWTQFDIPTQPMCFLVERAPGCRGTCHQGRADCPHPLLCGAQLSDAELVDYLAEQTHDPRPVALDDARAAAAGIKDGIRKRVGDAVDYVRAIWRAL